MDDTEFYRHRGILPDHFYGRQYNNDRRCRVIAMGCLMHNHPLFVQLPTDARNTIIRKIERSCYNQACMDANEKNIPRNWENPLFIHIYNQITYKVQSNLEYDEDDEDSGYLIENIIKNTINPETVGELKSVDLRPSKNTKLYEEIEERKHQRVAKKYSSQHECPKCHNRKTEANEDENQNRSLDEGSTITIKCGIEDCGFSWKISS
jgi:DNA-directed RNA polymerase subunit M/transcription elongation factor TFIIS